MQSIGVLVQEDGGRRPPMATFSHKGRRREGWTLSNLHSGAPRSGEPEAAFSASMWRPALFSLDARELDHLRPLFDGLGEDRPEFRRCAPKHGAAQLDDPGFDFAV